MTTISAILKISFTCIRFVPDTELSLDTEIIGTYLLTFKGSQLSGKESILKGSIKLQKTNSIKCWRRNGKLELSDMANVSVNWYGHFGKLVVPYIVKHVSTP